MWWSATSCPLTRMRWFGLPLLRWSPRRRRSAIGAAVVTDGGDLPVNYVIHAVIRSHDEQVSLHGVERALTSALQRAADWQLNRLVMPPLGTGAGNLKLEDVARVTTNVLETHLKTQTFPSDVTIVVSTDDEKEVFDVWLKRLA